MQGPLENSFKPMAICGTFVRKNVSLVTQLKDRHSPRPGERKKDKWLESLGGNYWKTGQLMIIKKLSTPGVSGKGSGFRCSAWSHERKIPRGVKSTPRKKELDWGAAKHIKKRGEH